MKTFFESQFFENPATGCAMIALTLAAYLAASRISRLKGFRHIPSLLVTAGLIFAAMQIFGISDQTYKIGGDAIIYILGPATVALAYPLFKHWQLAKQNALKIAVVTVVSGVASVYSTILMCRVFGVDKQIEPALVSKCVTTPVAIEISKMLGTYPELSVCAVFVAGIFGAFCGHAFLRLFKLRNDAEFGMSMGAISHIIGTAKCLTYSQKQGALSALTLVLCAIFTAVFTAIIY